MNTDSSCTAADMFQRSVDATSQLLQASSVATGGLAMSFARSVNLSLAVVAGMFCIYLGWKLYHDTVISKTAGEFSWKEFRVKLTASGPGVFLVFFGAWLIYSVVSQRLSFGVNQEEAGPTKTSLQDVRPNSRSSKDFQASLLLVQATPTPPKDQGCAVRKAQSFGFSGQGGVEANIKPQDIENALDTGISQIRKSAAAELQANPQFNIQNYAQAIRILNQMRANVVAERL
jgi:hypothetical protein